tara:strand:- start:474 stop:722 length:249 start_codon:yes stop_codon:yes gene_type:complete
MDIKKYIGTKVAFDDFGGDYFWGEQADGGQQMIAEIRGFGAMQNLFKYKDGSVDFNRVEEFRTGVGNWIADAINQKLERERK